MRVFVTGHRGYIGVHLVDLLRQSGHHVTGCDLGLFEGCDWEPSAQADRELDRDVRSLEAVDLSGYDAVCHLAAISNDPMGELDPELTLRVNRDASVHVARVAKAAGVERFVFAGSCSVYGAGGDELVTESAPLRPISAYARSKIEAEEAIAGLADDAFSPTFLRNATAFGHSPMLRIDLVANNLLACAHATGAIRILSDGSPWRPLIHCRDIARAFVAFAEAPRQHVHGQSVNVGDDAENFQVREIAERVGELVPEATIEFGGDASPDPRSYRVSFGLLRKLLPTFRLSYTLSSGLAELDTAMRRHEFDLADWQGDRFVRLRVLRNRLHRVSNEVAG